MPHIERTAAVAWQGSIARGGGMLTAASGAFGGLPVTLASRIGDPEGKTSPEELLAAAHAACFAMALGSELARDGTPPETLRIECTIVMDEVEGQGHQIVGSRLRVEVDSAATDDTLEAAVVRADDGCPFSALLKRSGADVEISRA